MALCSTFSTVGAMRLLVVRSVVSAAPACWPRIRSTTSRAFCGEIRIYRASAFACMLSSMPLRCLGRLRTLLRRRLHRVALKGPRRRKLAQFVPHHVLGHIHRDEFLPVVHRHGVPHEFGENGGSARPGAHHLLLIGRRQHRQLGFQVSIGKRSLLYASAHSLTSSCSCGSRSTCRCVCCCAS